MPRRLRAIGFDDAPFSKRRGARVAIAGVVCNGTRFEGMLWGKVRRDGWQATNVLSEMLLRSKFLPQVHLILLDGIAFGGMALVDLPGLSESVARPCVAVMRKPPDLEAMYAVIEQLPRPRERRRLLERAGPIHIRSPFVFQVAGLSPEDAHEALQRLTDQGHVPEALRLAHLIGAAVQTGQSGRRA